MLQGRPEVPRLERLDSARAQELLREGQAFVAPMQGLLGDQLLKWDFAYLRQHLPAKQKYGVMLDEGSGRIVMSHTARNGQRQVDLAAAEPDGGGDGAGDDAGTRGGRSGEDAGGFGTSDQTRMTFEEFSAEAQRYRESGGKTKLPYFGIHLLWRFKPEDNGYLGNIDKDMQEDLWTVKFDLIKEWQEANLLPLVQRFYLFVGLGGTLYHCHYDLQPNLHVQLTGRKRFILFPPDAWPSLYPFPVHHDLDRRSMVDLDAPDGARFPEWPRARGTLVELSPGDALYIPPYWWHHVQSLTPETTSMAMWFFEFFPLSAGELYGVSPRAADIVLMRDVEELVGKHFADVPGEEDCSKSRPVKAGQVAAFMRWIKPRLGLAASDAGCRDADRDALRSLKRPLEEVEALALAMVQERLDIEGAGGGSRALDRGAAADPARATLASFLRGRF